MPPVPDELPEDPEPSRLRRIDARLRAEAGVSGWIPFDRFVEIALYDDPDGFYRRPELALGREGEFYTAAHVSPLFGAALARRVIAEHRRLGAPADFAVVEAGVGDGTLAIDLRSTLAAAEFVAYRHVVVDHPGARLGRVTEAIARTPGPAPEPVGAVAEMGPFRGVVVANELLDALPFRRFLRRPDGWAELGVELRAGRWVESDRSPHRPAPPPPLPEAPEGTTMELGEAAEDWVRELSDHLVDGAALLIDYGAEEPELVGAHPRGTLAAVRRHRTVADPLSSPGSADLSVFVNFSRIRSAAERGGLRTSAPRSFAEALGAWGIEAERDRRLVAAATPEERVKIQLGAKSLLFGFDGFRVLELEAGPIR